MTPAGKITAVVMVVVVIVVIAWTVTVILFKAGGSTDGPRRVAFHTIAT